MPTKEVYAVVERQRDGAFGTASGLGRRRFLGALGTAACTIGVGSTAASAVGVSTTGSATTTVGEPRGSSATVYIGSYSTWGNPPGPGFQVGTVTDAGELTITGVLDDIADASFFAFSPDRRTLYLTNELPDGTVTALDITDPRRPAVRGVAPTRGAGPTHLCVHPSGRYLLTANYTDGSVVVHALLPDGGVGESTDLAHHVGTERDPHAHQVLTDPSGRWVLAVDLGGDSVYVYTLSLETGRLSLNQQLTLPSGFGPRHLACHPNGDYVYILGELRSEITVAAFDSRAGRLTPAQVIGTLGGATPEVNYPAEIVVSPDGRFVYVSNRGHDSIATFSVSTEPGHQQSGGLLEFVNTVPTGGAWPRQFTLHPRDRWVYVANQNSNTVTWLPRDPHTGLLGPASGTTTVDTVAVVLFR